MKRLVISLFLLVLLVGGCSTRRADTDQTSVGRHFTFGTQSAFSVIVKANKGMENLPDDMPALVADLVQARMEARNVQTGKIYNYRANTIFDNEAYKEFKMKGGKFWFEVIIGVAKKEGHLVIVSGCLFDRSAKSQEFTPFPNTLFSLKTKYSDPESQYIGLQTELTPIIEKYLDSFFETVRNKYKMAP